MLRIAIILATIVATTFGSLGLPIYLHTCRMIAAQTEEPGCSMCGARESRTANHPVVPDTDQKGPCCGTDVVNQRVDAGTMSRAEMPLPLFVGIVTFALADLLAPSTYVTRHGDAGHSPPGLAARTQHTYLLNSTFLI